MATRVRAVGSSARGFRLNAARMTRSCWIALQVTGDVEPKFEIKLQAAANHDAGKITPKVSVDPLKP